MDNRTFRIRPPHAVGVKASASLQTIRRALMRHRRLLAALAAAVAVYATLVSVHGPADGTAVLTVSRAVAGGVTLQADDLVVTRWPPAVVPDGALTDPSEAVGHTTVAAIPRGDIVARSDLTDGGSLVNDGFVALPVRFASGAPLELLRVGDRIDLLGQDGDGQAPGVLASKTRVVAIPASDTSLGSDGSGMVLVEVTPKQAASLTNAASTGSLSFALR